MKLKCGMIVKSVAGRDKDRFYLVLYIKNGRAFIADGKVRLIAKPKPKNFIHLKVTKDFVNIEDFDTNKKLNIL